MSIFDTSLVFAFNHVSKAARAARDTCVVYGNDAAAERPAGDRYVKFKNGNSDLKAVPRPGHSVEFDEEQLKQLLHEHSYQMSRKLAEKMEYSHTAIKHLHSMGKVQICGTWVPHPLSKNSNIQQTAFSVGLLARRQTQATFYLSSRF